MQACGRLVARMREQDVNRDIGAGIELDGGIMAPAMGDLGDPAIDDRYFAARQIGPDIQRRLVIVAEQAMRVAGEAIARQAGIENGDLAAGTAELQGGGETGKAAADDDDVIHGGKLRVVDGGGWAGPGAQYRPAIRARDGQRAGLRHRRESRPSLFWPAGQCRIRYRRTARGDLIWRTG